MANYVPAENLSFKRRGTRRTMEFRTDQKRPSFISEGEMDMQWRRAFQKKEPLQLVPDTESPGGTEKITVIERLDPQRFVDFYQNPVESPLLSDTAVRVLNSLFDNVVIEAPAGDDLAGCVELKRMDFATQEKETWFITPRGVREYRRREAELSRQENHA